MMFNRQINDDLAVVQEIVNEAVGQASVPGVESFGNAAGAYSAVSSGLIETSLAATQGVSAGAHFGESGVDAQGREFHPFILGFDTFDDEGAYWVKGAPLRNYGN